ncbi:terminase small subunit [Mycobacterium phage Fowlmouth]|uniref:Uncharacterized protein n=1 Tax=Mycobacterium phage Fowlmouth TaxID=2419978 RepID=A0A3G2KGG1_9CAUD|nr:terminase small subunit [Mycobacterium phage Fowlmouth]AYN58069.1 hypothetical protein SEA_FOWLMOUTH_120 [Mycobacterium phage Fowlmouth]
MSAPVKFVGVPDGPARFIKEFGCEVGTFVSHSDKELDYHVPLEFRGDYRPTELANYDPQIDYRTDIFGKCLCTAKTKQDILCERKAVNRSWRCPMHGGQLNRLDRIAKDKESASNEAETQGLSRYRQFQEGIITVDDLDDEELAQCGFKAKNGVIYKPKNVPRELANAFQKAIFERANAELRGMVVDAAKTVGEIMNNKTNEPDIRLKAALSLIERGLGKTPNVVAITQDKPFEVVFDAILHSAGNVPGAAQTSQAGPLPIESAIDAESFEIEQPTSLGNPGVEAPKAFGESDSGDTHKPDGIEPSAIERIVSEARESNPRLRERNPAILAQTIEIKPFEYDLSDQREAIDKAIKKRYASRALGIDLTADSVPFIREEWVDKDGVTWIRHVDPNTIKTKSPNQSQVNRRKSFTLNDFE